MFKGVENNRLALIEESDFEMTDANGILSPVANSLPMPFNKQAPRTFYGSKFFEQALPLKNRAAPWVRNLHNGSGRSWDFKLGPDMGALFAQDEGVVDKVGKDSIRVKTKDGKSMEVDLYDRYPFNRHTMLHNTPVVKKGDTVKAGQLLASSNFTDNEGRMALGVNARVALVPFKGQTMDDASVISEEFARTLTSEHANTLDFPSDDDSNTSVGHFVSLFPHKFTREQLKTLSDDGMVKPGTILKPGDPLRLATRPKTFNSNADVGRLSRSARFTRKDASVVWDGDEEAEVLDVVRNRRGDIKVMVRYDSPAKPGDKLAFRNGQKTTIADVLPRDRMPKGEDGEPLDILLNQLGLPSRVNSSTYYEMLLGKIAAKSGKAQVLPSTLPEGRSMRDYVEEQLAKSGISPYEILSDPATGRSLDQPVTTGNAHVLKLHHQAKKKLRHRGQAGYDINRQPLKGGGDGGGAQRLSGLEMSVLHSSGARGVQKESLLLRGELREDYWRAIRENRPTPDLGKPYVWEKFRTLLDGSGMHARDLGKGRLRLTPLTDRDIDARDAREILHPGIVNMRTLEPEADGLFDPTLTRSQAWGKVTIPPMINPAYENQVRVLLGLTGKELDAMLDEGAE